MLMKYTTYASLITDKNDRAVFFIPGSEGIYWLFLIKRWALYVFFRLSFLHIWF